MAQISMEAGLAACREKLGELTYENVLLRAQLKAAEAELEDRTAQHKKPAATPDAPVEIQETEAKTSVSGGASR